MLKSSNHKGFRGMLFIFLINHALCAQHAISKYEYRWAFWHPIAAVKIEKQLPEVMVVVVLAPRVTVLNVFVCANFKIPNVFVIGPV